MSVYFRAFSQGLKPDENLTLSEWADKYRILPSKGAAEPGRWRTARTPYLKEIMDCLSPQSPVRRVVFQKSSQVGGTEILINFFGFIAQKVGGPMMIVQPTIELAERFSKQRIAPMIEETPELRDLIAPARTRDSGNSILLKEFRGGVLVIAGSNSATSLRSMPVRFLACDEISAYAKDVGSGASLEGDPVSLAEKRTQTFSRRKIFLNSTPTSKDDCRIEQEYNRTDQRRYFVPCPHCSEMQWLKFRQLKWEDGNPRTARYECEKCGERIEEWQKTRMLAAGEWRATAYCEDPLVRGYHISALYSPLGWKSWAEIAEEFLKSKSDPALLRSFINSILGETFEEEYAAKLGADGLKARAELYDPNSIPDEVLALTAGVDVQDNRMACTIYGWGRDEECFSLFHQEIFGDPARPEIWKQLDEVLLREYKHNSGIMMNVAVAAIDTGGHFTHETYGYVRERKRLAPKTFIIGIKGQSQRNKPAIGSAVKVDINYKGQKLKAGVELYPVGTDTIKSTLYGRMKHNEPGPGYVHFHASLPDYYFEQITSEKQVTRFVKGFPIREWTKRDGVRNEALDCFVYAYAAMQFLYLRYNRATIWDQLEKKLHEKGVTVSTHEVTKEPEKNEQPKETPLRKAAPAPTLFPNAGSGGFINRW